MGLRFGDRHKGSQLSHLITHHVQQPQLLGNQVDLAGVLVGQQVLDEQGNEGLVGYSLAGLRSGADLQSQLGGGLQDEPYCLLELLVVLLGLLAVIGGQDGDREQFVGAAAVGVDVDHGLYRQQDGYYCWRWPFQ